MRQLWPLSSCAFYILQNDHTTGQHLVQAVHTHTPSWRRLMFSNSTGFPTLCRRRNNDELPANVDPNGVTRFSVPVGGLVWLAEGWLLTVFGPTAITNQHDGLRVPSRFTRGRGRRRTRRVRGAPSSTATAHTIPKRSQHEGPIVHRREVLSSLLVFPRIKPRVQQHEQVASRLQTMFGELVRPSVEGPRRSRIEVHANGESDRIQRRWEVKRHESWAWMVRKGGRGGGVCVWDLSGGGGRTVGSSQEARSGDRRRKKKKGKKKNRATDLLLPTACPRHRGVICERVRRTFHPGHTPRRCWRRRCPRLGRCRRRRPLVLPKCAFPLREVPESRGNLRRRNTAISVRWTRRTRK